MYSVNLLIFVRNFIEVVVIGRYCFIIGLKKKCIYILIDNIDVKELNIFKVNYLLGKGVIENFESFYFFLVIMNGCYF